MQVYISLRDMKVLRYANASDQDGNASLVSSTPSGVTRERATSITWISELPLRLECKTRCVPLGDTVGYRSVARSDHVLAISPRRD
jgi:hypothetical protein